MDVDLLYRLSSLSCFHILDFLFLKKKTFLLLYFYFSPFIFCIVIPCVCHSVKLWMGFHVLTHWPRENINLRFLKESKKHSVGVVHGAKFHITSRLFKAVISASYQVMKPSHKVWVTKLQTKLTDYSAKWLTKKTWLQILCFWTLSIVLSLSKNNILFIFQNNVPETGFCLLLQVKPTQLGPIGKASPYLRMRS
jgi:hypothetical protein